MENLYEEPAGWWQNGQEQGLRDAVIDLCRMSRVVPAGGPNFDRVEPGTMGTGQRHRVCS
jgi:hypothetical protein